MKRRITAVFMALCIAMTLLPMSALAEEPAGGNTYKPYVFQQAL